MDTQEELAGLISEALLAHPSVAALDDGPQFVTYLPHRRITGVRIGDDEEPVEVSVVLRLDGNLPGLIRELRAVVREVAGDIPVNMTVADVVPGKSTKDRRRRWRSG
jgi:hypothetical protein